jgi:hypothetical protein
VKPDIPSHIESFAAACLQGLDDVSHLEQREPRLLVFLLTGLAIAGICFAVPDWFAIGPRWPYPIALYGLLFGAKFTHFKRITNWNETLGAYLSAAVLLYLLWALVQLLVALVTPKDLTDDERKYLLLSAALLWLSNVLVFSLIYWRRDAGGPNQRDRRRRNRSGHRGGEFLFPQMQMEPPTLEETGMKHWHPQYVDYLFLAFNTSTALSPTDTTPLTTRAKGLMMLQALIALVTLALLAGRAVNIL